MDLSNDQTQAAMHGLGKDKARWEPLELTGDQLVDPPAWCGGAVIDWHEGFSNRPTAKLKQSRDFGAFSNWIRRGSRWIQTSTDGSLMHQHVHSGGLSMRPDGSLETTKQEGYAGRTFTISPVEGLCDLDVVQPKPLSGLVTVHLLGPWFGGCPPGWSEMIPVDMRPNRQEGYDKAMHERDNGEGKPWYRRTASFGYYVSDAALVRILRKYCPELPLARVWYSWSDTPHVEAYKTEWGAPKAFKVVRERGEGPAA